MKFNMIFKPKRFDIFTPVPTSIFRIQGISLGAVGLYCYLLSHDNDKPVTISFCANNFKEGKDAIRARLKELETFGLVRLETVKNEGVFRGYNYHLIDPTASENPTPRVGLAASENPTQRKYNDNNIYNDNINYNDNIDNINNINKNNIPRNLKTKEFPPHIEKAFPHFVALFPKRNQPKTKAQKQKWLDCLDKIERIDKYNIRDVYSVCKQLRQDDFWQNVFLSVLKLRNNDKNGVKYVDRFMSQNALKTRPNAFKRVSGLIDFVTYEDKGKKIGAKTNNGNLYDYNLKQLLSETEYNELFKYLYK
ncbi:MAG: hypothetical protein Unbinned5855contig1001_2 [Prokaryotic dsDNA virus sp.]|nr:MAG: hypothetical protein Unbinned5855contig1001_2 [Prokaryotic dsDNA virus sp.]|tara:strand:- start:546 stop:1466 length:921 start_codon:yes stop_codon:yes gene_type:complete